MRQTLCDRCAEPIDLNEVLGDGQVTYVTVATGIPDDGVRKEYHRRCARGLTVDQVWQSAGLVPL